MKLRQVGEEEGWQWNGAPWCPRIVRLGPNEGEIVVKLGPEGPLGRIAPPVEDPPWRKPRVFTGRGWGLISLASSQPRLRGVIRRGGLAHGGSHGNPPEK
jgi:hypothetical protein